MVHFRMVLSMAMANKHSKMETDLRGHMKMVSQRVREGTIGQMEAIMKVSSKEDIGRVRELCMSQTDPFTKVVFGLC